MARIRTIKPEFWADEKLSLLDPLTRLVFLGLISMADDAGRLVDNVKLLDGMLFPSTDDTCRQSLEILARMSRVIRYRSTSGQALIQIANWATHQKVDNPAKHLLPGPGDAALMQPAVPSADTIEPPSTAADTDSAVEPSSRDPIETLARLSRSDLRPTTVDRGPRTREQLLEATRALSIRANQGLAEHPTRAQLVPRILPTSGSALTAAQAMLDAGVPLAFAETAVYEIARSHGADREVRSLGYFVEAVVRRWQEDEAATAARERPKPAPRSKLSANGGASSRGATGSGAAAVVLQRIVGLVQERSIPGQPLSRFIPRAKVAELGDDVLQAYDAVGGADRVLSTTGDKRSFLTRDFAEALEAVRSGAGAPVHA